MEYLRICVLTCDTSFPNNLLFLSQWLTLRMKNSLTSKCLVKLGLIFYNLFIMIDICFHSDQKILPWTRLITWELQIFNSKSFSSIITASLTTSQIKLSHQYHTNIISIYNRKWYNFCLILNIIYPYFYKMQNVNIFLK